MTDPIPRPRRLWRTFTAAAGTVTTTEPDIPPDERDGMTWEEAHLAAEMDRPECVHKGATFYPTGVGDSPDPFTACPDCGRSWGDAEEEDT